MDVRGRGVLVTGGGRGLGAALGRELARAGARVVLVARTGSELDGVVEAIRAEGGTAHALVADVGVKDDVYPIAGAAAALAGPIDVLVHNASALGPVPLRPLMETDCEDLEATLAVNLVGPFRLTKAVAGGMAVRGGGLVVHVTSDASVAAYAGWGAYGVSKAALDHLGRIWGEEMRESGVRFLTVDPGEMDTRMHAEAMPDADRTVLADPAEVAARLAALIRAAESVPSGSRIELAAWRAEDDGYADRNAAGGGPAIAAGVPS
jgi:NAD(P)-dependent dehydrogenase (short-subunit alcohol dehydrogenase family)